MEGKLVAQTLERIGKNDSLDSSALTGLQDVVTFVESICDGLGFCLSEKGDLLSQWRGYAADAGGFSIGFSKKYLSELTASKKNEIGSSLLKVCYTLAEHEDLVRPTYETAKKYLENGKFRLPRPRMLLDLRTDAEIENEFEEYKKNHAAVYMSALPLLTKLYALKSIAFQEEQEWRMMAYSLQNEHDSCCYRAMKDRIVPYMDINLVPLEDEPIVEVLIGPKNLTPVNVVEGVLKKHGFNNVSVTRSIATYR
jgi:hypothetical protein